MRPLHCLRELRRGRSVIPHPDNLSILRFLCARELVEQMETGHVVATELGLHFFTRMWAFAVPPGSEDEIEETAVAELEIWVGDRPRTGGTIKMLAVQGELKPTESDPAPSEEFDQSPAPGEEAETGCAEVCAEVCAQTEDRPHNPFPHGIEGIKPDLIRAIPEICDGILMGLSQIESARRFTGEKGPRPPKALALLTRIRRLRDEGQVELPGD